DPELRYVSNGHPMAQFTLAVDRDFKNAAGDREADFIKCVAWRKLAEQVGQYCARGRLVAVEGRLQSRAYEASDGARRRVTEVVGASHPLRSVGRCRAPSSLRSGRGPAR